MSTTRRPTRLAALLAASALVLVAAPSWADESGSPAPSPEATTTSEGGTNPAFDAPETVDTYVGQSVQVRKDADGFQNSQLANFRWVVTQVNAESLNDLDVSIPLPMDDAPGLRSLTGRSNMPTVVDGGVLYDFDNVGGIQTKRTLNLWPQDRPLPVDVTAEFTLNGEKVTADEIVGQGGLVTATYTIVNQSVQTQEVEFENVQGEMDTKEVDTSQAFVGISKALIPQSWAQFDPGNGIFGADGRGNFQTQWISLAFLPFAKDGKASFGWSAVIPEGEAFIPKMVIEVSPLYVPTHVAEEDSGAGAAARNAVPKPNLDAATASVQSGVEDLVAGVNGLADTLGKAGDVTKEGIQIAVSQITAAITDLCAPELLDCATEDPPLDLNALIAQLKGISENLAQLIADLEANGGNADDLIADIEAIKSNLAKAQTAAEAANELNDTVIAWVCPGSGPPVGDDQEACNGAQQTKGQLDLTIAALGAIQASLTSLQDSLPGLVGGVQAGALKKVKATVDSLIVTLTDLQTYLEALKVPLADLQAGIAQIGAAIDAGLATAEGVGSSLDQIARGKAQVSAGLGQASEDVRNYLAEVVAVAEALAESAKETAADVEAQANTIKAEMAGLLGRMAESPLPYSGGMNTVFAPAGDQQQVQDEATALVSDTGPVEPNETTQPTTELFGAYQFMLDPADNMRPTVPWRIGLAILLVIGGGLLGMRFAKKAAA